MNSYNAEHHHNEWRQLYKDGYSIESIRAMYHTNLNQLIRVVAIPLSERIEENNNVELEQVPTLIVTRVPKDTSLFGSYSALLKHLKLKDEHYHSTILKHSQLILDELVRTKKAIVATELGMSHTAFSEALKYITAYVLVTKES